MSGLVAECKHKHGNTADNGYIERYFELLKDAKVKGYLFAQQNYVDEALKR